MVNTTTKVKVSWIQAIGLVFLVLLTTFLMTPSKSYAFDIFNSEGNDGYFLSLTNDPEHVRIVPVAIYDNHPKKQNSKSFIEYQDVEVNYADYDYNKTPLPAVEGGDDGRTGWVKKVKDNVDGLGKHDMLGWTFPGFAGKTDAENYRASQADLDRATWVGDTLVQDFNNAISMVHNAVQEYGDKDIENMNENQFANMIRIIANAARTAQNKGSASFSYHGVTFNVKNGVTNGENIRPPKGVPADAYVTFTLKGHSDVSKAFIEYVPKGYRKDAHGRKDMEPMYDSLNGTFQSIVEEKGDKDLLNLNWMLVALQSNSNWSANNMTFTNIGDITQTSKFEQFITDMASNLLAGLRQMLGLYTSSDLIMNGGTRGTDNYFKGIMPQIWMKSADVLHWISYALSWMLIIGAVVKLLVQRNIAAINPSQRVDMINGIKNLMIVGFALSIYDVAFAGLTEMNYLIVDMLSKSGTGIETFGQAPVSSGMLASVIVGIVFFCLDVYFNFFYIARALMVAILYAVGPLYVASIAFGEKYRQIFGNYCKELIGNIFVQSFQAILVVFFVGISIFGSLRTIETMVLLFCFIPMTKFFKESIGASGSTTDALSGGALSAGAGLASGIVGSALMKNRNGKNANGGGKTGSGEGGLDIQTKSGSSFTTTGGGGKPTAKSMIGVGVKSGTKALAGAGMATVGAGLAAGGAATGMHGLSQIGGFLAANGVGKVNTARKDAGISKDGWAGQGVKAAGQGAAKVGASVVKGVGGHTLNGIGAAGSWASGTIAGQKIGEVGSKIANSKAVQGTITAGKDTAKGMTNLANKGLEWATNGEYSSLNPQKSAANRHGIMEGDGVGLPEPTNIQTLADGSSIQTFDKKSFSNSTGITSMRDLDNLNNEMEIGTGYVDGQGFITGAEGNGPSLNGSAYEQKIGNIVNAFKNNDADQIKHYQHQGIMGMNIDRNSGRVSFTVDKDRIGIGEVYNSGDDIHIQRKQPTSQRPRTYAQGNANPFSDM